MGLRITLKPNERLLINGAAIRNGPRSAEFVVETHCRFLREGEIVRESEADTPCKQLCVTIQVVHLAEDPSRAEELFYAQALELMALMPSAAPFLAEIRDALSARRTHLAVKIGRRLVAHEAELRGLGAGPHGGGAPSEKRAA